MREGGYTSEVSVFTSIMSWAALFFTLGFFCKYCATQDTVTQSASTSVSIGDTVIISCTVKGFNISDRYVHWYQQKEGNKPRYLLWYHSDSNKNQGTGVPDRFSGSKDSPKNTGYLTIKQCTLDDEAVYYCTMWHRNKDWYIFGPGTTVAVSSGEVKAPSVFIMKASDEELKTDKVTIVCTASDYTPRILSLEWLVDGTKWTTGIDSSSASKLANNLYSEISFFTMTTSEFEKHQQYACKVTHEGKEFIQTLKRSECF